MYKKFMDSLTKEIPYNENYLKILLHNLFEKPTFNDFIKSIFSSRVVLLSDLIVQVIITILVQS
jgi:hypothetical protein